MLEYVITLILFYAFLFIQVYVGVMIPLIILKKLIFRNKTLNMNNKDITAIFKNILIAYLFGYLCAFILCVLIMDEIIILVPLYLVSLIFAFPISVKDSFEEQIIAVAFVFITLISSIIIHCRFFSKKVELNKKYSIISSLMLSFLTAPYLFLFSYDWLAALVQSIY